jgi:hypothetical protein
VHPEPKHLALKGNVLRLRGRRGVGLPHTTIGTTLGLYEIVALLGAGGMGEEQPGMRALRATDLATANRRTTWLTRRWLRSSQRHDVSCRSDEH